MSGSLGRLVTAWRGLRLDHFTFVMATGIVSTALHNTGAELLSLIVLWIAIAGYAVLVSGVVAGSAAAGIGELGGQVVSRRCGTLAFVAAGGVLAARFAAMGLVTLTLVVIVVSAIAWAALQYGVLGTVVGQASRRRGGRGAPGLSMFDGTWFLVVVSTQALAVSLGAWSKAAGSDIGATLAVLAWGLGILQLAVIAPLVAARLLLVGVRRDDEVAPYWVFLGSGAISILGAAEVLGTAEEQIVMPRPVIGGIAMALWAFVTWMLIPTIALMLWQRSRTGAIRGYRPALWAMVFPIGMYGESTRQLGYIRGTSWLDTIGTWESWVALAVWLCVAALLVGALARIVTARRPAETRRSLESSDG